MNLFKKCSTTKDQGNIGEAYAIAYFTSKGFNVSSPLTENQLYDLIVEIDGELKRVQVKTTSVLNSHNSWEVGIKTTGRNTTNHKTKFFNKNKVDILFILTSNGEMYLIESDEIESKSTLSINKNKYLNKRVFVLSLNSSERDNYEKEIYNLKKELKKYKNLNGDVDLSKRRKEYHKSQRKVERPPYDQLLKEIEETNYSEVGRKYGVSDNAIRKWVKWYKKHEI